jgi:fatty-acyl-CoA synthase
MHGAAQWTVFAALHNGRTVALHDDAAPFDIRTILETAQRERANLLTIVGDAYARPMSTSCAPGRMTSRRCSRSRPAVR